MSTLSRFGTGLVRAPGQPAAGKPGWATKTNKSFNFVTAAQLDHIRELQAQRKYTEAATEELRGRIADLKSDAYALLLQGGFGSRFALTETLTRATPLIFTGLAAALAFRARLFNIGAEGQIGRAHV